ncbi:hypothetical protein PG999_005619 [Apiospora kogelbergensis]|uniref:Aminoglycoside phosphotransferase domain-containing protein n=1 Tax=Apiospora kogelbergensis TaxID=1337665 RepID=A0AAW0R2L8_9PEZI
MAAIEQNLTPDESVLSSIFPEVTGLGPTSYHIISNTRNTCTFSIHHKTKLSYPKDILIRLETSSLAQIAAIQSLAFAQLPDLVPPVLDVGTAISADGKKVSYYVTPYLSDTILLEDVWDTLDKANQEELMDSVVHAVEKLQELDLSKVKPGLALKDVYPQSGEIRVGNPRIGFFTSIEQFLRRVLQAETVPCRISEIDDGIVLESDEEIGRVELSRKDLDNLLNEVVFCHNDLEARNILAKQTEGKNSHFRLAAIIDWEMAGFYPFAYEYSLKDTALGLSNQSFSWYSLFKQRTYRLLPHVECNMKLIKALGLIDESKKRSIPNNVGVRFQAKWRDREQIERSSKFYGGWVRKPDVAGHRPFTKDDQKVLEIEILQELGLLT